jgi:hypothetical protein
MQANIRVACLCQPQAIHPPPLLAEPNPALLLNSLCLLGPQDNNRSALAILLLLLANRRSSTPSKLSTADAPQSHAYTAYTAAEHLDATSSMMIHCCCM